jgi:hypothetical protein
MSVDFHQIHQQVKDLGAQAGQRELEKKEKRQLAWNLLHELAPEQAALRVKIDRTVRNHDPNLRCARPIEDPINTHVPVPAPPPEGTLIAADGSQINPDRHTEVDYCLINVGAIEMVLGTSKPPSDTVRSELFYDEQMYTPQGTLTEATLALLRDLNERTILADLVERAPVRPVITFTDGPLELWGAKGSDSASGFQHNLKKYLQALDRLRKLDVTTAGYVDKPGANLAIRMLEVALTPENELDRIRDSFPLRGVTDRALFYQLLAPGERSAVFAMQSKSAADYREDLGLHFFYLNVGRENRPYLARVEIPGWVVAVPDKLAALHSILVEQCRILGSRPYPYLLHRAHEVAVVTRDEKDQVTQMIVLELLRQGVSVDRPSEKQAVKEVGGRNRH